MQSSTPTWRAEIQKLQNKSYGEDLKAQLIFCLDMCNQSHFNNTRGKDEYYAEIIDWDGMDPLPPGWIETPGGEFIHIEE